MTTELKKILNEDGTEKDTATPGAGDINNDNDKALKESQTQLKRKDEEIADLKFNNEFKDQVATFPLAKDHEDDIKAKVKAGYSTEDATVAVLQKEGKLKTADQISSEENKGTDLGGRTPPNNNLDKKDNGAEKTADELAEELKEFERKGEFKLG